PLIAQGAARYGEGKAYEPAGESALDSYRAVLKLDPRQEAARKALAEVEQGALKQALSAASQNDYANADRLIAIADSIGSPDALTVLGDTRKRVGELKREFAQGLIARAG